MLGTIVFLEEPRSKAEQGAELFQKIFSLPGVPGGFSRAWMCEPPPTLDIEKVGFLALSGLLVFGQPQVYDGEQILTIAIGVHDEVS